MKSGVLSVFTKSEAIDAYRQMFRIRKFEEKCGQIYGMGQIAGFCHLCIGQEAIPVGVSQVMKKGGSIITGYRDHGHNIVVGTDPKNILAELMGKETGISKGKGGSMHLFDVENGFFGGHGIVGAQVSIGTGLGFANKYKENDNVSLVFFGDGAANQGQVYESFNMAKIWNLPVLYVIENNKYAMGTSVERHSASEKFYTRGKAFEIPSLAIDAMDIIEVKKATGDAIEKIRSGSGPILIEVETYRYRGHSMPDPGKYRTKEELDEYKKHDPIEIFLEKLVKEKLISEGEVDKIAIDVKKEIEEIYDFCVKSNVPDESELFTNVYSS